MKRTFLLALLLGLWWTGSYAQHSITATEVENWVTPEFPDSDFNLNSVYLYLINGHALEEVFSGNFLSKNHRKELDLKKGDYPQYLYLAIQLDNPLNEKDKLTVPLLVHDTRNPSAQSRVVEYGGRFLENIPDEILKNGDIVAKVKFEAFKGNTATEFWKKTAQISLDLGKTATNLLQAPLTGTFLTLTKQIIPQVDKGLKSMENIEDPQKMTSEFYIRLINKELSALYREHVVSASVYEIHWDIEKSSKQNFFNGLGTVDKVDALRNRITDSRSRLPYLLVVNTKSEYNTDHSELIYNQGYIEKKANDFRKIRNIEKRNTEQRFLEGLKTAVELKKQIDAFNSSLNTKYPDWHAYSRIIDLYYDLRILKAEEMQKLASMDPFSQTKYAQLYSNVQSDIDLWFTSELLIKGRGVANFLLANRLQDYAVQAASKNANQIYEDLVLLDFYRDRVQQTEIQGKLPKEIEALESYTLSNNKLFEIESALYQREFNVNPNLPIPQQKEWLLEKSTRSYPLCKLCATKVGEEITRLDNKSHEENVRTYQKINQEYYNQLDCYESIYQAMEEFIRVNTDSLTVSPFRFDAVKRDREEFLKLSKEYSQMMGQDYMRMPRKDLSDLLSQYYLIREKMAALITRLRTAVLQEQSSSCL